MMTWWSAERICSHCEYGWSHLNALKVPWLYHSGCFKSALAVWSGLDGDRPYRHDIFGWYIFSVAYEPQEQIRCINSPEIQRFGTSETTISFGTDSIITPQTHFMCLWCVWVFVLQSVAKVWPCETPSCSAFAFYGATVPRKFRVKKFSYGKKLNRWQIVGCHE